MKLARNIKIYVVGDSTACDYADNRENYYLPLDGYGAQLKNYLNLTDAEQVVNLALSGRSSLSFLKENNYNVLKESIEEGDFLIIGFGHNDEKSEDKARFTDPSADYLTAATKNAPSFEYTLYENYVRLARDKRAVPILCTPIVRYAENGAYSGGNAVHVTAYGDYPAAIKRLGAATGTAVVDLTEITKEYYSAHGESAKLFHAFTTYKGEKPCESPDGMDTTHLNGYGAKRIAYWLLNNLPDDCPLKAYVKRDAPAPRESDFISAINENYEKPV